MSTARTHRRVARPGGMDTSYERFIEALEEAQPTLKYRRSPPTSGFVLRVAPRDFRGPSASSYFANRTIRDMLREIDPPPAPAEASRPLVTIPRAEHPRRAPARQNVFLRAPLESDPPPPWAHGRVEARPARRSMLPLVTLAMALAIGAGLSSDDEARSTVASELARAAEQLSSLVLEMMIR